MSTPEERMTSVVEYFNRFPHGWQQLTCTKANSLFRAQFRFRLAKSLLGISLAQDVESQPALSGV